MEIITAALYALAAVHPTAPAPLKGQHLRMPLCEDTHASCKTKKILKKQNGVEADPALYALLPLDKKDRGVPLAYKPVRVGVQGRGQIHNR